MLITRTIFTDESTIGEFHINENLVCYTLEDTCRSTGIKIPGRTAIPAGTYEIVINMSQRFGKLMPLLLSVPGFTGIRIHSGDNAEDTQGCILVGMRYDKDVIYDSRKAFDVVMREISKRLDLGPVYVTIAGGRPIAEIGAAA